MGANLEPPEVPEKRCPECGAKAPVYELLCPLCGHEWLPSAAPRGKNPAARLFVALAVALGGLLLALCVLFGIIHSYVRR